MAKISVVINTRNEEKNLPSAIASIRGLADEVVVVDMESADATVDVAKRAGAKVYSHKPTGYVEPARNFAISKATGDWVFILDADERATPVLIKKLKSIASEKKSVDFYRIPRKNIIFGKWIRNSRWWPDYNIRFLKKGAVLWSEIIHSVPETHGKGADLPAQERYAILHYNYTSISQYLERLSRYTDVQAKQLINGGYKFSWRDIVRRPASEFLGRFFVGEAYKDGVHGLVLSILQAFSEAVVYIRVWELQKYLGGRVEAAEIGREFSQSGSEFGHWLLQKGFRKHSIVGRLARRLL